MNKYDALMKSHLEWMQIGMLMIAWLYLTFEQEQKPTGSLGASPVSRCISPKTVQSCLSGGERAVLSVSQYCAHDWALKHLTSPKVILVVGFFPPEGLKWFYTDVCMNSASIWAFTVCPITWHHKKVLLFPSAVHILLFVLRVLGAPGQEVRHP